MLKCCIIYFPGSGGTFLRRALSLSNNTTAYNSTDLISVDDKIKNFQWDANNWKKAEQMCRLDYKIGKEDFGHYERSELYVIDSWHPEEFYHTDQNSLCWEQGAWQDLIFINVNYSHKEFLMRNQTTKKYNLNWSAEEKYMDKLCIQYPDSLHINFDDLLEESKFENCLDKIKNYTDLIFDKKIVLDFWKTWVTQSNIVWKK